MSQLLLISDLFPLITRYEWQAELHPRVPAGSPAGGEFRSVGVRSGLGSSGPTSSQPSSNRIRSTKKREIAALPDTIHEGHSLHLSKLPPDLAEKSRAWSKQLHNLMAGVESAKSPDDQEIAWAAVNKDEIRKLLDQMNSMDKQYGAQTGQNLSDWVNANGLIPRSLAERLDGGERFFNPERIRSKLKGQPKPSESNLSNPPTDADLIRKFNSSDDRQERKRMLNDPVFKSAMERAMGIASKGPATPEPKPDNRSWKDDSAKVAEYERRKGLTPSKPKEAPTNYDNRVDALLQRRDPDGISNQPIDQVLSEQKPTDSAKEPKPKPKKQDRTFNNLTQAHFTKLKNAIADYLGTDSPEHQAALETTVPDAWRKLNDEAEQWNSGLREIVGQAHKNGLGAMMSNVHRVADPMSFKGFDQLVHHAEKYYPQIVSHPDGPEEGLMQALKSGIMPRYGLTDPEVIDHAVNLLGPSFRNSLENLWQSNEELKPLSNEDREAIPFSVRAMMYAMGLPILRSQSVVT
ncbi:MAG: hypothetical protein U0930_04890 [Pirellulales bacterium]